MKLPFNYCAIILLAFAIGFEIGVAQNPFQLGFAFSYGGSSPSLTATEASPLPSDMPARMQMVGYRFVGRGRIGSFYWGSGFSMYNPRWELAEIPNPTSSPSSTYTPYVRGTYVQFPLEIGFGPYFGDDRRRGSILIRPRIYVGASINLMMASRTDLYTITSLSPNASTQNLPNMEDPRAGYHIGIGLDVDRFFLDAYYWNSFTELSTAKGRTKLGLEGLRLNSYNLQVGILLVK